MSVGKLNAVGAITRDTPLGIERAERAAEPARPRDPRVENVAKLYEKQFLREMVKAMRGTVAESELNKPSMGEQIYRGQLDEQYVEVWGDSGGIGLSDLIYNELMEKILDQGSRRTAGPRGPIALTDRDIARITRMNTSAARQAPLKIEVQPSQDGGPARVLAPWDSRVLMQTRMDGRSTVLLEHEGGVRSALIFDGVPATLRPGSVVKKGVPVGILSPESKSFFWNLNVATGAQSVTEPASIVQGTEESSL